MGFFKKIGSAVKKGLKQVSLKNVVKLGTPFLSMIPIVGSQVQETVSGLSAAAEAKKQARQAEAQGQIELAQAYQAQADALSSKSGAIVGQNAGSVFKAFTKGATDEGLAQVSNATKQAGGSIVAELADQGIIAWIKKHTTALIFGGLGLVAIIVMWFRKPSPKKGSRKW